MGHQNISTVAELTEFALSSYRIDKQIDGYPEIEGRWPLIGARVMVACYFRERQTYYEPVSTYDDLLVLTRINDRLLSGHAPFSAVNRLMISFRMFGSAYKTPPTRSGRE